MRRSARPIASEARSAPPSALNVPVMPSSRRIGPLTMTSTAQPPVLEVAPWSRKAGSHIASTAAATIAKSRGRQPAITALTAAFSAVIARRRTVSTPSTWPGAMTAASTAAATRSGVGGVIGRPSVQPRASNRARAASSPSTEWIEALWTDVGSVGELASVIGDSNWAAYRACSRRYDQ